MYPTVKPSDDTPQIRAAKVTLHLIAGQRMTTAEIATLTGLTYGGALRLMVGLSIALPVLQIEGRWQWMAQNHAK